LSASDSKLNFIFSEKGPLAEGIPGYRTRQQQLEMALAIAKVPHQPGGVRAAMDILQR
jgi:ATP-dependent DNA helicase DinG